MIAALAAKDAEIARLREALAWQPIETAPKGEMVLGHDDGMVRLVLAEGGSWVQVGATIERGWFEPTRWMPLPTPPLGPAAKTPPE